MARNKEEGSVHCSDPSCFRNAAQLWNRQRSHSNPTSKGKPVDAVWQEAYHKSNKFRMGERYTESGARLSLLTSWQEDLQFHMLDAFHCWRGQHPVWLESCPYQEESLSSLLPLNLHFTLLLNQESRKWNNGYPVNLWQAANIGLRNYKTGTALLIPECELVAVAQVTLLSATLTVHSDQQAATSMLEC